MNKPLLHLVGGPTASGKTALALKLAHEMNGAIINADAMQLYAGLPILTAQPTAEEKASAPHFLFEIFDADQRGSAGKWLALATAAIEGVAAQGLTPIVVGGTGLYFRALLGGLADIPPIPEEVHQSTVALYDTLGHDDFRQRLAECGRESAARIAPNDRQRLIRAFEVASHTGKTLGDWQKAGEQTSIEAHFTLQRHLLLPERTALYAACDARFEMMMKAGALEEVRALLLRKLDPDLPSMKILGVPELAAHLRGEMPLKDAIAKAQQVTRNYAKRQVTWFRNQWKTV